MGRKPPAGDQSQASPWPPALLAARAAALPVVTYPDLPVSQHKEEIADAIRDHQVVIVAGETGSGKTTQLPKILLEQGYGIQGMVGHTQPRRIAARAVAERIADELGTTIGRKAGDIVGYQVRFTDEVGPTTLVKLMTDGILLSEIGVDPLLKKYQVLIIDEAHERSLNIDFLLGYLGTLLPKRPDLKVIVTSATIDSKRFAKHFEAITKEPVPIIEVSGRAFPVEVRYRPLVPVAPGAAVTAKGEVGKGEGQDPRPGALVGTAGTQLHEEPDTELAELGYGLGEQIDLESALCAAVDELLLEPDGDILVFLPGERDIREAQVALADHLGSRYVADPTSKENPRGVEILPLFARLSAAQQHQIYAPHSRRRIVLATNIAETSLTVPGVRFVIDSGLARISRFSNKTKVQRLPIERISQASAAQRAGRAGRTSPGVAIRLFSREDHEAQSEFTEPEILRTSLAAVILQMSALGLGEVNQFPFLDSPSSRAVRDGVALLEEIGALGKKGITPLGRKLARLPIDPRLGRMLLEADRLGCASEVLVIVAALSIQDVRERPLEFQQQADQAHRRFADKNSDFITYLNIWRYLAVMSRDLSGSAFRRLCRQEFFHYLRYREWRDIVSQLRRMAAQLGIKVDNLELPSTQFVISKKGHEHPGAVAVMEFGEGPGAASADEIHQAILPGLLSNIGSWDETKRNYSGTRGGRFTIWPGSGLSRRTPAWVMAAELVETSQLFARTVGVVRPQWIEKAAGNLVKRSYSEPVWSRARGQAVVRERVTLYGLTLAADRQVPLSKLGDTVIGRQFLGSQLDLSARELAREMFLSNALVDGDWRENHHAFVKHNRQVLEEAEQVAARLRDPAIVPDEAARYRFFEKRVPASVISAATFNQWWKHERTRNPHRLDYVLEDLVPKEVWVDPAGFPNVWSQGDLQLHLTYNFDPGEHADGVVVSIPLRQLQQVKDEGFDWLVPGLQLDLATALIRGLPKAKRKLLAPAAQTAEQILAFHANPDSQRQNIEPDGKKEHEDTDPFSLEASLDRLRNWGAGELKGSPVTRQKPQPKKPTAPKQPGGPGSFFAMLAAGANRLRGVELTEADLAQANASLPPHLRIGFQVVDERGAIVGVGENLTQLQKRFSARSQKAVAGAVREALQQAGASAAKREEESALPLVELSKDVKTLPAKPLPPVVQGSGRAGARAYPALSVQDNKTTVVDIKVFDSPDVAAKEHQLGLVTLLLQDLQLPVGRLTSRLRAEEALRLAASPYPNTQALVGDAQWFAARSLLVEQLGKNPPKVRSQEDYEKLKASLRDRFEDRVHQVMLTVVAAVTAYAGLQEALDQHQGKSLSALRKEVERHAQTLFKEDMLRSLPLEVVQNLPRYLKADAVRLQTAAKSQAALERDLRNQSQLEQVLEELERTERILAARPFSYRSAAALEEVRVLVEELRVSLFAQSLGVPRKVSVPRLLRQLEQLG